MMMKHVNIVGACLVALCLSNAAAAPADDNRDQKLISLFEIVKFPNDVCVSNNRNGTCYTADECASNGGTSGDACADGFGVCCTFVLSCGNSTSQNNTYLVQAGTTSLTSTCTYTICKSDDSICRIKFDFNELVLADPVLGTAAAAVTGTGLTNGGAIGDCTQDTFSINNNGKASPPTICGTNTGQHMIVDASDNCHTVSIDIGSSTATSRSWTIAISQYTCDQEELAGPSGCLQYHTGNTGRIANFGRNTAAAVAENGASTTHLSNQKYDICIRREATYCYICYVVSRIGADGTSNAGTSDQTSFGLSLSGEDAKATSIAGSACDADYITIPGGQSQALASAAKLTNTDQVSKLCGRVFETATATDLMDTATARQISVCTNIQPFTVSVNFDADEVAGISAGKTNEQAVFPGGIVGFDLTYIQGSTNCS